MDFREYLFPHVGKMESPGSV